MTAMDLDGDLAQPQFAAICLFIKPAVTRPIHLAFALGQAFEACPQVRHLPLVLSPIAITLERRGNGIQHVLIAKRLVRNRTAPAFMA